MSTTGITFNYALWCDAARHFDKTAVWDTRFIFIQGEDNANFRYIDSDNKGCDLTYPYYLIRSFAAFHGWKINA